MNKLNSACSPPWSPSRPAARKRHPPRAGTPRPPAPSRGRRRSAAGRGARREPRQRGSSDGETVEATDEHDQPDRRRGRGDDARAAARRPQGLEGRHELHRVSGRAAGQHAARQGRGDRGILVRLRPLLLARAAASRPGKRPSPDWIKLRRVPVVWNEVTREDARLYFTLEGLGLVDKLHAEVFRQIHAQNRPLTVIRGGSVDLAATEKAAREFLRGERRFRRGFREALPHVFDREQAAPGREPDAPLPARPHADDRRARQVPDGRRDGGRTRTAVPAGQRPRGARARRQLTDPGCPRAELFRTRQPGTGSTRSAAGGHSREVRLGRPARADARRRARRRAPARDRRALARGNARDRDLEPPLRGKRHAVHDGDGRDQDRHRPPRVRRDHLHPVAQPADHEPLRRPAAVPALRRLFRAPPVGGDQCAGHPRGPARGDHRAHRRRARARRASGSTSCRPACSRRPPPRARRARATCAA